MKRSLFFAIFAFACLAEKPATFHSSEQVTNQRHLSEGVTPATKALRASVRLSIEDETGSSFGTGTIIGTNESKTEAIVLTCGHTFRDSLGSGKVTVQYGFGGQEQASSEGTLLDADWESRDIALVKFPLAYPIEPVEIANRTLKKGDKLFSIGCSHGADPTKESCKFKTYSTYEGVEKIDTNRRPTQGRSGGGLFLENGDLIGVCNAAAVEIEEGIYAGKESISWQIDQWTNNKKERQTRLLQVQKQGNRRQKTEQPVLKTPLNNENTRTVIVEVPKNLSAQPRKKSQVRSPYD